MVRHTSQVKVGLMNNCSRGEGLSDHADDSEEVPRDTGIILKGLLFFMSWEIILLYFTLGPFRGGCTISKCIFLQ